MTEKINQGYKPSFYEKEYRPIIKVDAKQIVDLFNVVITNENMRLNNRENAAANANASDIYLETTYSQINSPLSTSCPITREDFLDTDAVIMIRECRHVFKKTAFQTWIENNNTCPCCRITLRDE